MKQIFAFIFVVVVLFGCSVSPKHSSKHSPNDPEEVQITDHHTSQNSLSYHGTYQGTVPCASCEGIQTVIILGENDYKLETVYLGKDSTVYKEAGTYSWNADGQVITLAGIENGPNQYFVGENYLIQLDMDGNKITGDLAGNYILVKTE